MITKEQKDAVHAFLKKHKHPVKRDAIARLLFMNPVKIRQAINALVSDGIPIVSDYKEGFRIAKYSSEFDEEMRRIERMAKTLLMRRKHLRNLRDTLEQNGKLL
jgi:hypothetical protein